MGREFELKFRADDEKIAAIRAQYGPFREITMETAYYDAPDRALGRLHWTLRRRYENGISVCTLKTPGAGFGCGEWETECDHILTAIPILAAQGAPEELLELTQGGVSQVCAARFTRLAAHITVADGAVELALDRGVLLGGGRELPFAEVEVELKQGSEAAAVRFAQALAGAFSLEPESRSKVQRALALANQ